MLKTTENPEYSIILDDAEEKLVTDLLIELGYPATHDDLEMCFLLFIARYLQWHWSHPRRSDKAYIIAALKTAVEQEKNLASGIVERCDEIWASRGKTKMVPPGLLARSVDTLNLPYQARNCMRWLKIKTIGELIEFTANKLLEKKNFGSYSLHKVRSALAFIGLKLKGD